MKIYAKTILADTLNVHPSEGWEEFEPQFKGLIKEKEAPGPSKQAVALQEQQKDIVDTIGAAADYLSNEQYESTQFELQKIKGKVYHFLNAVQQAKTDKVDKRKALIENMLTGLDQVDKVWKDIDLFHKTKDGNLDDLWQRLLKITAYFMAAQVRDIVAHRIIAKKYFRIQAIDKKVLKEKKFDNYILRKEQWRFGAPMNDKGEDPWIDMAAAYSVIDDSYIGDNKQAKFLCEKMGIIPEKAKPSHNTASIGFCPKDNKWYGWSHRAIEGFGIGDEFLELDPWQTKKGPKIKTLEEAKKAAIAFAESVS